jgi:hypothetical protein
VQTRKATSINHTGKNVAFGTKEEVIRILPKLNLTAYDN